MKSRSETARATVWCAAWLDGAALLFAAGYAGPLVTLRALFGPAGRRRSLEERGAVRATPHAGTSRRLRQ